MTQSDHIGRQLWISGHGECVGPIDRNVGIRFRTDIDSEHIGFHIEESKNSQN